MECEVNVLKRKVQEYQEHTKNLRDFSRAQRDKLKQVIVACASQLQEKEAAMEQVNCYKAYSLVQHSQLRLHEYIPRLTNNCINGVFFAVVFCFLGSFGRRPNPPSPSNHDPGVMFFLLLGSCSAIRGLRFLCLKLRMIQPWI